MPSSINRSNSFRTMKPKVHLNCMSIHYISFDIIYHSCKKAILERKLYLNFKEVKLYIIWVTLYFCCYKEECCKVSGPSVFRPFMLAITYQYRVVKLCILKSITSLDRPRCNSSWVFEGWSIYHLCTQYQESVICKECTFPCFSIILYMFNGRELVWRISAFLLKWILLSTKNAR